MSPAAAASTGTATGRKSTRDASASFKSWSSPAWIAELSRPGHLLRNPRRGVDPIAGEVVAADELAADALQWAGGRVRGLPRPGVDVRPGLGCRHGAGDEQERGGCYKATTTS